MKKDEKRTKIMGGREKIKKEIRRKSKRNRKQIFILFKPTHALFLKNIHIHI
jgi:hypothetical protein